MVRFSDPTLGCGDGCFVTSWRTHAKCSRSGPGKSASDRAPQPDTASNNLSRISPGCSVNVLIALAERHVLKAKFAKAPEQFHAASPLSRVHAAAPPMLIVHGDQDTLVPVNEARQFFEAYRQSTSAVTAYAEIPGAQHAFEIFPSLRTGLVLDGVERFVAFLFSRYQEARARDGIAAAS